jgi:hypothetical protein
MIEPRWCSERGLDGPVGEHSVRSSDILTQTQRKTRSEGATGDVVSSGN